MTLSEFIRPASFVAALALLAGCGSLQTPSAPGATTQGVASSMHAVPEWQAKHQARRVCPEVVNMPECQALLVLKDGKVPPPCSPSTSCGWTPAQLQAAYGLTPSLGKGAGTKVAVIEAGDDPNAATNLATYRSQYGLGTASFFKYNETGQQSNYPPSCQDYGWCAETNLDVQMISASCPKCTILLMEAKDGSSISDFETAEAEAVTLGATIVSNSWGCPNNWDCGDPNFESFFDHTGVAYLASTGDSGYNTIGGPSVLPTVIGVGGTQLALSGTTYSETIWSGASAGCGSSSVVGENVPKPSWQHDPDCAYRTDGDISSESGCQPGVAEYASEYGGWIDICGTSVASPFIAGVIALAGNAASQNGGKNFWTLSPKHHKTYLHHPSGGCTSCGNYVGGDGRYKKYYSGPGGWGTPKGIKAF